MSFDSDIIIVGAGLTGLAATILLAEQGFTVTVIDRERPALDWDDADHALRVSALSQASQKLLSECGVWSAINQDRASTYQAMLVWDALTGKEIYFDSADVHQANLGHIVENRVILRALWERAQHFSQVNFEVPAYCECLSSDANGVTLALDRDVTLSAKLLIGADGGRSWVREHSGIDTKPVFYGQQGLVATIKTERPHQQTAWQRFLDTGPLALLPFDDANTCSIVWTLPDALAAHYQELSANDFNQVLTEGFDHRLGQLSVVGKRACFPLVRHHAERYVKPGIVLIGDAAHTVHPLAGQGVNLGWQDVAKLVEVLTNARSKQRNWSGLSTLTRFEDARRHENGLMQMAFTGLNSLFSNDSPGLAWLRGSGLNIVNTVKPLKKQFMRKALGV